MNAETLRERVRAWRGSHHWIYDAFFEEDGDERLCAAVEALVRAYAAEQLREVAASSKRRAYQMAATVVQEIERRADALEKGEK